MWTNPRNSRILLMVRLDPHGFFYVELCLMDPDPFEDSEEGMALRFILDFQFAEIQDVVPCPRH
jgi:hypothetical protein